MTKKDQEQKTQPVIFYGKKAYRIHLPIFLLKAPERKLPDYRHENIDETEKS